MVRGDVIRARIPFAPGHAQSGERPAIIVQDEVYGAPLSTVLIVPFTSNLRASRYPATVLVQPDGQNGLTLPSVAMVFQMRVLDRIHCGPVLGRLDIPTLDLVFAELDQLTGR
jgi:mRNA interferase MazF